MPARRGNLGTSEVLLLGAAGNSGALIGAELAARGLSVLLAGRRPAPLDELAQTLTARGARAQACPVDIDEPRTLSAALTGVGVVLNTVGPFTRRAGPVIAACLAAGVPYVDIANEFPAVWGLLDRDEDAHERGVVLVTGAGFGPAATETRWAWTSMCPPRRRTPTSSRCAPRGSGATSAPSGSCGASDHRRT
jgi:saccharopine dehydrogenase (NAD+, L-lysine-forming)